MKQGDLSKSVEQLMGEIDKKCIIGSIHHELEKEDFDSLKALFESSVSNLNVSQLLKKNGYAVGETAVWKHRTQQCRCKGTK